MPSTMNLDTDGQRRTPDAPAEEFRDAFARLPSGVCVVSCAPRGQPHGMTASAVCSLSLNPQLVVVCLANDCATLAGLRQAGRFAINVLRRGQSGVASQFASARTRGARFAGVQFQMVQDSPVLEDVLAWLTCDLFDTYPGGDHTLVIGAVTASHGNEGDPLVWHDRRFRTLA